MTRRSNKGTSEQPGVSLFPFLAVLLCTMGMLVMLLVAIGQGTSSDRAVPPMVEPVAEVASQEVTQAESGTKPEAKTETIPDELKREYEAARKQFRNSSLETVKSEVENSQWFLEELREIHKRTTEALKVERDRLGSLETAMSTRFRELKQLRESVKLLQQNDSAKTPDEKELDKSIAETTQKIESMKKEIETIKKNLADSQDSYAVVPYRGKSGTQRRPIYIECTKDAIRLMPEGIEFSVEDFILAKSPANPFDTAVRTARTCYMNKYGQAAGEPYPLLIVRPGGADKYYAALAALSSWGGDYGYEFVDENWKLEYPPADEDITNRVREQVAYARYKLAAPLAAMMAQSPHLAEQGFSGDDEGTGFKTGVSVAQEAGGSPFGENVRLSPNAGYSRGAGTGLLGNGYRGGSAGEGSLYANDGRSGLIPMGNGSAFTTGTGNDVALSTGLVGNGSGSNTAQETSALGGYRNASLLPGYSGSPVAAVGQSGSNGSMPSGGGQPLPTYEGQYKYTASGQSQAADSLAKKSLSSGTGQSSVAAGHSSVAAGHSSVAAGQSSAAAGQSSVAVGQSSVAVGQSSVATGQSSVAAGQSSVASGQLQYAGVPGDQTTGRPARDPSAAIVSQIEGQDETTSASESGALENGWVTVGNTAMQRQTGGGSSATDQSCPVGSNCPNPAASSGGASQEGTSDTGAMPQMVAERRKDISDKKKEKKDPYELAPYDPYKNQGFNLAQQNRQPVNSMVERPIRVECYPDRIVFPKQPGIRSAQTVMLNQDRKKVNEQLLRQVALCVKTWGVAGRNMYWTPWIRVQTASDAGRSAAVLQEFFPPQGIAVRPDDASMLR